MALFLFLLAKAALGSSPIAHIGELRPPFPIQQAQWVQAFLMKPAPFCKLLDSLASNNKTVISLSLSYPETLALFLLCFPLLSFILSHILRQVWQELSYPPHLLSGYTGFSITHFSQVMTWQISWPDKVQLLQPSIGPCSLSPLNFHIHSFLFSNWKHNISSKFFDTQVHLVSTEELVLSCYAHRVLSCICCHGHSLLFNSIFLEFAKLRILCAVPAIIPLRSLLISFCTVLHWTLSATRFLATPSPYMTSCPSPEGLLRVIRIDGLLQCLHPLEEVG